MDYVDLMLEASEKSPVYEGKYFTVKRILKEIPVGVHTVRRLQLVIWKYKETDIPDIDIRTYSKKEKIYKKGVSFTINEAKELYKGLKEFFELEENDNDG